MRLPLLAGFLNFPVVTFGSGSSESGCHSFRTSSPNDMPALLAPRFRLDFFPRVFMRPSRDIQLTVAHIEYLHRSPSLASPSARPIPAGKGSDPSHFRDAPAASVLNFLRANRR
jgi:hypothetical protein